MMDDYVVGYSSDVLDAAMQRLVDTTEWQGNVRPWREVSETGEDSDDAITAAEAAAVWKFDASEPRDTHGRWTAEGHVWPPHETWVAIHQYVQGNASYMNGTLRDAGRRARGEPVAFDSPYSDYPVNDAQVDALDAHMQKNLLPEDTTLFRTVPNIVVEKFKVGDVYQDDGYVSTTRDVNLIPQIRQDIGARMEIHHSILTVLAPKGLGHIDTNADLGEGHEYAYQREVILPRGSKFQVVSKGPGNTMTVKVLQ